MEHIEGIDRRIFERIPVNLSMRFMDMDSNDWQLVQTQDMSAKGIGVVTERDVPLYTPLEIWLPIVNKGESYYTRGQVVWSKTLEDNKYRVGIELEKPDFMGISQVLRAANVLRSAATSEEAPYQLPPSP